MKPNSFVSYTTLALLAMVASLRANVLVESFETSPVAYPAPGAPYTFVGQSSTAGVTDGTYSMSVSFSNSTMWTWIYTAGSSGLGYYGATTYADWYNHTKLQFDLHRAAENFGWNLNFAVAMNGPQGWNQLADVVNWVWHNAGQSSSQTVTWDYSAIQAGAAPGGTWWQLAFMGRGNNGGGGNFHIDNVRFIDPIPEPTTASLLGLAMGIGLLARWGWRARSGKL